MENRLIPVINRYDKEVKSDIKVILDKLGFDCGNPVGVYLNSTIGIPNSDILIEERYGWDLLTGEERRIIISQTVSWYTGLKPFAPKPNHYAKIIREFENLSLEYQVEDMPSLKGKLNFLRKKMAKLVESKNDVSKRVEELNNYVENQIGNQRDNIANLEIQNTALSDYEKRIAYVNDLLSDLKQDKVGRYTVNQIIDPPSNHLGKLFAFVDFLHLNIVAFRKYEDIAKALNKCLLDMKLLNPDKSLIDKLRYDELDQEVSNKHSVLKKHVEAPIKNELIKLKLVDPCFVTTLLVDDDIRKYKKEVKEDDIEMVAECKNKYLEVCKLLNIRIYMKEFFTRLDAKLIEDLFGFFDASSVEAFNSLMDNSIGDNDLTRSTIEDYLYSFKEDKILNEPNYTNLVDALHYYLKNNKFPVLSEKIKVGRVNKKRLGWAINQTFQCDGKGVEKALLVFAKENISTFADVEFDISNLRSSNLYKYFTTKA